jgi:hypothetical protein
MTVAVTRERVDKTMALLRHRAARRQPAPSNTEIAKWIGLGKQRFQPADRMQGIRTKKHEAGTLMIRALERDGLIEVERGRNWRCIKIRETGEVLPRRPPSLPE